MTLPIDFTHTHFPIKEKYIDNETAELGYWMEFGAYDDGTVAICDSQGRDLFTHVPKELATRMVHERNVWVQQLLVALNGYMAHPGWPRV